MSSFHFAQLADPQFGMFASVSLYSDEDIESRRAFGLNIRSGNHDVGGAPTSDSLALYRERFGADNYSFEHKDCHFAVINSSLAYDPSNSPREWKRTKEFLSDDLSAALSVSSCLLIIRCSSGARTSLGTAGAFRKGAGMSCREYCADAACPRRS